MTRGPSLSTVIEESHDTLRYESYDTTEKSSIKADGS